MRKQIAHKEFVEKQKQYQAYFNVPIKFKNDKCYYVNERIVEKVFVHKNIEFDGRGKRVLEFGCTRSDLAIQLASLGYEVIGIDLREYPFTHPNLKFYQKNVLDFEDNEKFDYITALSTIEHIGLGAYGEKRKKSDLYKVIIKLSNLLKLNGKLIVTVPFGQANEDNFVRSFTFKEIQSLFNNNLLNLIIKRFYYRSYLRFWLPCDIKKAQLISNSKESRGPTGANCVGCFVWEKIHENKEE